MATMSVSTSSTYALHGFYQVKGNPNPSASWSSMDFPVPSINTSRASSKSPFFPSGFSRNSAGLAGSLWKSRSFAVCARATTEKTIHDFNVKDIDGKDVPLRKVKGKVLLIVNVASKCGLTSSNY